MSRIEQLIKEFSGKLGLGLIALASLALAACGGGGGGDSGGGGGGGPTLVSMAINPSTATVSAGLSTSFTAQGTFSDSSTSDVTSSVIWSSDNVAVATAGTNKGSFTGAAGILAPTDVTIRASSSVSGVADATALLTVTDASLTGIAISPVAQSVPLGTPVTYTATGTFSAGLPGDVSGSVSWSSDNPCVSISASGVATTISECVNANISATASLLTDSTTLTVTPPVLKTLTISPATANVTIGGTLALTVSGKMTNGNNATAADWGTLTCNSSDMTVATVTAAAVVSGLKKGAANIDCSSANGGGVNANTVAATVTTLQMGGSQHGLALTLPKDVTTLAGMAGTSGSTNATGTSASFYAPAGITADANGTLYVADNQNHEIRKVDVATGATTTLAGTGLPGVADHPSNPLLASFNSPNGITTDGNKIYVADTMNHAIRMIEETSPGVIKVSTLAGVAGSSGSANGAGSVARFSQPRGITADGSGNLYVADTGNNSIRKIVIAGGMVSTLSTSNLLTPFGITTDGTNLYVANTGKHDIQRIVIAGGAQSTLAGISTVLGTTDGTGTVAQFSQPFDITSDGHRLYVTDSNNNTIRQIAPSSGVLKDMTSVNAVVTTLAGSGVADTINGNGTAAAFNAPHGITTDNSALFITENGGHTIRKLK